MCVEMPSSGLQGWWELEAQGQQEFWWGRGPVLQSCDLLCISCNDRNSCKPRENQRLREFTQSQGLTELWEVTATFPSSSWPCPPQQSLLRQGTALRTITEVAQWDPFLRTLTKVLFCVAALGFVSERQRVLYHNKSRLERPKLTLHNWIITSCSIEEPGFQKLRIFCSTWNSPANSIWIYITVSKHRILNKIKEGPRKLWGRANRTQGWHLKIQILPVFSCKLAYLQCSGSHFVASSDKSYSSTCPV